MSLYVFKPGSERRSKRAISSRKSRVFPPCFVCASRLRTLFFSSLFFSLHVTSDRLRSHADASYRAAVCIFSVVLLLTVLSFGPSFLYPPRTRQRALTRYIAPSFLFCANPNHRATVHNTFCSNADPLYPLFLLDLLISVRSDSLVYAYAPAARSTFHTGQPPNILSSHIQQRDCHQISACNAAGLTLLALILLVHFRFSCPFRNVTYGRQSNVHIHRQLICLRRERPRWASKCPNFILPTHIPTRSGSTFRRLGWVVILAWHPRFQARSECASLNTAMHSVQR